MKLPSLSRPVLSRATPVARTHAGIFPSVTTAPAHVGCAFHGLPQCGGVVNNAAGIPMVRCCDPGEVCTNGACVAGARAADIYLGLGGRLPPEMGYHIGSFE